MKYTTLNEIKLRRPCGEGWDMLLASLNKTEADDEPLSFKYILESNGIKDAVWALCVLDYKDQALFRADVAELVLPIFEEEYPNDSRPRKAIEAIRDFYHGKINEVQLKNAACVARDAYDAASIARAAYAAYASWCAGACRAYDTACVGADSTDDAGNIEYWNEVEQLFIKYYC